MDRKIESGFGWNPGLLGSIRGAVQTEQGSAMFEMNPEATRHQIGGGCLPPPTEVVVTEVREVSQVQRVAHVGLSLM